MRETICIGAGVVGGFFANITGGWDESLIALVLFMVIDYLTGLVVACVFHKSPKTETGALESNAGWKGLCRKCMTLFLVIIAHELDVIAGTNCIRDAVIIGFIVNEAISITENAGLMGLKFPKAITDAIEVLKNRGK